MPYLPESRQYRNFAASNFQPVTRDGEGDEQSYVVRGHFTTFREEYQLFPDFYESIDEHALDEADMSDVIFQLNHEGITMARQRNNTLRVGIDPDGGWCEADLRGCQQGRDLYEAITNGLIDEMSFGFIIADDGFEWEESEDYVIHSRITKIAKVFDVSAVSIPANPGTDISARSYVDAAIEAKRKKQEIEQANEQAEAETRAKDAASLRRRKALALELECIQLGH